MISWLWRVCAEKLYMCFHLCHTKAVVGELYTDSWGYRTIKASQGPDISWCRFICDQWGGLWEQRQTKAACLNCTSAMKYNPLCVLSIICQPADHPRETSSQTALSMRVCMCVYVLMIQKELYCASAGYLLAPATGPPGVTDFEALIPGPTKSLFQNWHTSSVTWKQLCYS